MMPNEYSVYGQIMNRMPPNVSSWMLPSADPHEFQGWLVPVRAFVSLP